MVGPVVDSLADFGVAGGDAVQLFLMVHSEVWAWSSSAAFYGVVRDGSSAFYSGGAAVRRQRSAASRAAFFGGVGGYPGRLVANSGMVVRDGRECVGVEREGLLRYLDGAGLGTVILLGAFSAVADGWDLCLLGVRRRPQSF